MINRLEFFVAVARERNFRIAAEVCGVAQPTLSAGIKTLEDELGTLLIHRSSRFHGLTAEGEKVLEWAKRMVADARSMRQELRNMRQGLTGHLRLAVIPTALAMVPALTTPYHARHPGVRLTVLSRTSAQVLQMLDELEVDAGITYAGNEPLGRVRTIPLYTETYRLVTSATAPLGDRDTVTWAEVGRIPLCLMTPNMQNRRILDRLLLGAGMEVTPTLESNSVVTLFAHVRTGRWATIMPEFMAETLGLTERLRSIPIVDPHASYQIGLVIPPREPMNPLVAALVAEARMKTAGHPAPAGAARDATTDR